jgi:hypothetical protein
MSSCVEQPLSPDDRQVKELVDRVENHALDPAR